MGSSAKVRFRVEFQFAGPNPVNEFLFPENVQAPPFPVILPRRREPLNCIWNSFHDDEPVPVRLMAICSRLMLDDPKTIELAHAAAGAIARTNKRTIREVKTFLIDPPFFGLSNIRGRSHQPSFLWVERYLVETVQIVSADVISAMKD
jgi:hypothetical protein